VIVDSSAIVAVLRREAGHELIEQRLAEAAEIKIGAPTAAELGIVLTHRLGGRGRLILARFFQDNHIETIPFTAEHAEVAMDAFVQYGKGHHPAKLNMGDCFTYATAKVAGEPLLCVGDDFPQTDLPLVELAS
jgi:ribonuclease VapC